MSNTVWSLSVDLTTKTASFTSGMADAARAARGSFGQIQEGAKGMGEGVQQGGQNVRAALGLIDNTIRGNHAAAMADLVREFQNTSVVMSILPFAAVIGGIGAVAAIAVEVAEKIKEWREEDEKLNREQLKFGTTVRETMNGLDDRLLQAGKRADELRNDHLGALRKELELIDHASMAELAKNFGILARAADDMFKHLESHWYTVGIGASGAKNALDEFQAKYESLLAQHKGKEASDLLAGTRESAERVLAAQKLMAGGASTHTSFGSDVDMNAIHKATEAQTTLRAAGVGYSEKEVKAQEQLLEALNSQVVAQGQIAKLNQDEKGNAKTQTGNEFAAKASEAAKQAAAAQLQIDESALAGQKSTADAVLEIQHASVSERLASELDFAARELQIKQQANAAEIAALNKTSGDYQNQLKALNEKNLVIEQQYETQVSTLRAKALTAQAAKDLQDYQASQRDMIAATVEGSSERLAAINSAMQDAKAKALQETDFYRQLAQQKVETIKAQLAQESKLEADAGRERADNAMQMAVLALQAEQNHRNALLEGQRVTSQQAEQNALDDANAEFRIKQQFLQDEIANLNKSGRDYQSHLLELQNRERQLVQQHENDITHIQETAAQQRLMHQKFATAAMETNFAMAFSQVLMGHQSFASMMSHAADQLTSNLITSSLQAAHGLQSDKMEQAKDAARWGFNWGAKYGGPAAPVLAPIMASTFFAGVMAFSEGTDMVPGVAKGDVVPAMLTPGEGVVPNGVMDGLAKVARNGGFGGSGQTVHVHVRPTYHVNTIDGDGMKGALNKHSAELERHFRKAVRKMNK